MWLHIKLVLQALTIGKEFEEVVSLNSHRPFTISSTY